MSGISIEIDGERIAAILARIDEDDMSFTGCALKIGEERGKKETGKTRRFKL